MTGAFIRIERDGKWQNIEFERLTKEEAKTFFEDNPKDMIKWLMFLHNTLADYVQCTDE
jgi:hypothetical protein